MKIVIYLFDGVTALDAVGPYESLSRLPEAEILFAARTAGPVRTGDGFLALHADAAFADVMTADMLIVPGGEASAVRAQAQDAALHGWLKAVDKQSRYTCSVCTGSVIVAAAGLLKGRRASTHWAASAYLPRLGATYSSDRVTIDGKYVTSAGVSAGIDMGLLLCAEIAGTEMAEAVQLSMEYDPQPPFDAGNREQAPPERVAMVGRLRT